jgi:DNA polymerase-3 subunit gamma/tau
MDYIELDAASNRSIDEIRDLIERAAYKPSTGRFKVFMIDEAHQLTKDAFNALLKTLEEPPEYLKFVLATTDPEKMLPTVLSRCLQFNLRPMAPRRCATTCSGASRPKGCRTTRLRSGFWGEPPGFHARRPVADRPGHRLRWRQLSEATVRDMLGSVDRGHVRALLEALAARNGAAVLASVDGLRGLGLSLQARWRRWHSCCSRWPSSRPFQVRLASRIPIPKMLAP